LAVAVLAGIAATAMVATVLAVTTDTVQNLGNNVTSQDYAEVQPGGAHNLEIGAALGSNGCGGVTYEPDGVITFADQWIQTGLTYDLTTAIEGGDPVLLGSMIVARYCIRNASGGEIDGLLSATLLTRNSTESGACGATELASETALGPVSCADGDAGELDQILRIRVNEGAPTCQQSGGAAAAAIFSPGDAVGTTTGFAASGTQVVLPDGAECFINVAVDAFGSPTDPDMLRAAVTDLLAFDIAINLTDTP